MSSSCRLVHLRVVVVILCLIDMWMNIKRVLIHLISCLMCIKGMYVHMHVFIRVLPCTAQFQEKLSRSFGFVINHLHSFSWYYEFTQEGKAYKLKHDCLKIAPQCTNVSLINNINILRGKASYRCDLCDSI